MIMISEDNLNCFSIVEIIAVIFDGMKTLYTKDHRPFTIKHPTGDDAESIIDYSKTLFTSTDQVLTTLDEYTITVEDEKTWINNFNANKNSLLEIDLGFTYGTSLPVAAFSISNQSWRSSLISTAFALSIIRSG